MIVRFNGFNVPRVEADTDLGIVEALQENTADPAAPADLDAFITWSCENLRRMGFGEHVNTEGDPGDLTDADDRAAWFLDVLYRAEMAEDLAPIGTDPLHAAIDRINIRIGRKKTAAVARIRPDGVVELMVGAETRRWFPAGHPQAPDAWEAWRPQDVEKEARRLIV